MHTEGSSAQEGHVPAPDTRNNDLQIHLSIDDAKCQIRANIGPDYCT